MRVSVREYVCVSDCVRVIEEKCVRICVCICVLRFVSVSVREGNSVLCLCVCLYARQKVVVCVSMWE